MSMSAGSMSMGSDADPAASLSSPLDLASNVAFFQMNVMLEPRPATSAAAAAAAAAAMQVSGFGAAAGSGAGAGAILSSSAASRGESASAGLSSSAGGAEGPEYEDAVVPLFKLVPGRAASSYGLACALRAGVPRAITDRAAAVSAALKTTSSVPPLPGFLEDPLRRNRERAQLAALALLLRPSQWSGSATSGAQADADGQTSVASRVDLADMLTMLRSLALAQ